jgi:acetyl-CoA acetyltransferase
MNGKIGPDGQFPVCTDGGLMSFSHCGIGAQSLQRVARGVEQLQGTCLTNQIPDVRVALCTNGGGAAMTLQVAVLSTERP